MTIPAGGLPILGTLYAAGTLPIIDGQGAVIPHVGDPVAADDAANRRYVDSRTSVLTSFATIGDVIAHDFTGTPNGALLSLVAPDDIYEVLTAPSAAIIAATDNLNIIQPTVPNTIRVVRKGVAAGYVANWYVNATTGNDTNDGQTALTPFATTERLGNALCPGGATTVIHQDTTVHLAAGTYTSLALNFSWPVGSNFAFKVQSDFTSSAPITLATVANTVESATSPVRGRLTTASGTFVDKKRIRSTSGANSGAITYSTGLNSSTDTWVKTWGKDAGPGGSLSVVNVAAGTTCVVDTLTVTLDRLQVKTPGHVLGGTFQILDTILPNGVDIQNFIGGSSNFVISQCELGPGTTAPVVATRTSGNIQIRNCRYVSSSNAVSIFGLSTVINWGCVFESPTTVFSVSSQFIAGNCFNGGSLALSSTTLAGPAGASIGATEWTNGAGLTAVTVFSNSGIRINGAQYGFGTQYSVGYNLSGGASAVCDSASQLGLPAAQQAIMAGHNVNYSQVPISYPNAACTFALASDPSGVAFGAGTALTTNAPANVTRAAAAVGTDPTAAHADHKHDIAVAAPVDIGTANSTGTAATLACSDHVHNLPFSAVNTALAAATASIGVNGQRITGAADPVNPQDLATKAYADAIAQGLSVKTSVITVATSNVTLSGLTNVINGIAINTDGMRVGVISQSTQSQNGLYVAHAGAWTRTADMAAGSHASGAFFFVEEGASVTGNGYVCVADPTADTVGTNNLPFTQFSGAGQIIAGTALSKSGNTLNVVADADGSITLSAGVKVGVLATDAQHGNRGGGGIHALAVAGGAAGFMSGTDKTITSDLATAGVARGDTLFYSSTGHWTRKAAGTAGQFWQTQGASADPVWASIAFDPSGAVTGDVFVWNGTKLVPVPTNGSANTAMIGNGLGYVKTVIINVDDDAGLLSTLFEVQRVGSAQFSVGVGGITAGNINSSSGSFVGTVDTVFSAGTNSATGAGHNVTLIGGTGFSGGTGPHVGGYAWLAGGGHSGAGASGNVIIGGTLATTPLTDFKSMEGGIWIPPAITEPTAAPATGSFLWSFGGHVKLWPAGAGSATTLV